MMTCILGIYILCPRRQCPPNWNHFFFGFKILELKNFLFPKNCASEFNSLLTYWFLKYLNLYNPFIPLSRHWFLQWPLFTLFIFKSLWYILGELKVTNFKELLFLLKIYGLHVHTCISLYVWLFLKSTSIIIT